MTYYAPTRTIRSGRSGSRRGRAWVIVIALIVVVLIGLDFAGRAVAQSVMASQIQKQGLPNRPSVSIDGFPFLTQVASRDFQKVHLSTTDVPAGPITISQISATASAIKLSSYAFNSGTIGSLTGTALISFASLGNTLTQQFGGLGQLLNGAGLHLTQAGPGEVKASLDLIITTGTATWKVTRVSSNQLNVHLVGSTGLPSELLGDIQDVTLQIPKLPLGLTIDSIDVTPQGVVGQVSGQNVPFGT